MIHTGSSTTTARARGYSKQEKDMTGQLEGHDYATHRKQIETILVAWGMAAGNAAITADILAWADLHGIDSHGISMLPVYDEFRQAGWLNLAAEPCVERETAVSALIDGGSGLGHVPAHRAMTLAIQKAQAVGIAAIAVRNSSHYGACGYYTKMAADAGLLGMTTTTTPGMTVAPTRAAKPRLGTDPISFAAPCENAEPFLLDMATATVASGRVRNKANEGLPIPSGWVLTREGQPSTDPKDLLERGGMLTPLGGSAEGASHKGYGLAAMVHVLSAALSGSRMLIDPADRECPPGKDIGHFFLALDPSLFRDPRAFRRDVAEFCRELRSTPAADPQQPVLVAGDPERAHAARRSRQGIPVAPSLLRKVRALAEAAGADWHLT